jgi:cytochrome c2
MQRVAPILTFVSVFALAAANAFAQMPGDPENGRAFALEVCTPCHVVAENQLSPRRLATAPDFRAIAKTRGMTETSLHAFLSTPHPSMPNLILSHI